MPPPIPTTAPAKRASESITEMTELVLPSDANSLGTAFGGRVMAWIDVCGAICAQRHCRQVVVTAHIDELHFHAPIKLGMIAALHSHVTAAFTHSLEVEVIVYSENPLSGERRHCCSAFLTFTALDDLGRPARVPPLACETDEERAVQAVATERRARRLEARKAAG